MTAPVVSMTQWGGFEDGGQNEQGNPPAEPNVLRHLHFSKGNSIVVQTHCRLMYPLHLSPFTHINMDRLLRYSLTSAILAIIIISCLIVGVGECVARIILEFWPHSQNLAKDMTVSARWTEPMTSLFSSSLHFYWSVPENPLSFLLIPLCLFVSLQLAKICKKKLRWKES